MPQHLKPKRDWVRPVIAMVTALIILVLFIYTSNAIKDPEQIPTRAPVITTEQPPGRYNGRFTSPTTARAEDLIAAARKIKPLEDLDPGDRVLYRKDWCYWREWVGGIATSKIECGEGNVFQVPTVRLTPVELKKSSKNAEK